MPRFLSAPLMLLALIPVGLVFFNNCSGFKSGLGLSSSPSSVTGSSLLTEYDGSSTQKLPVVLCAEDLVNSPSKSDASLAIEACARGGNKIVEFLPGRYYIRKGIKLDAQSKADNLVFRTRGVSDGPACLDENAAACAVWTATDAQGGGSVNSYGPFRMIETTGVTQLTFFYLALDGSRAQRTNSYQNFFKSYGSEKDKTTAAGTYIAWNARFQACHKCQFVGFASVNATQGSALNTAESNDVLLENVLIKDAGWGLENLEGGRDLVVTQFSDGLTHTSGDGLKILNSKFIDNSDVNLIIGGGTRDAHIHNNIIVNRRNYAFAAVMFDSFDDETRVRFDGMMFENNRIDCNEGMCGVGLMYGPRLWYWHGLLVGGTVRNNSIVGGRQGALIWYAQDLVFSKNTIKTQGEYTILTNEGDRDASLTTSALAIDRDGTTGNIDTSGGNDLSGGVETANKLKPFGATAANPKGGKAGNLIYFYPTNNGTTTPYVGKYFHDVLGRAPDLEGGKAFAAAFENKPAEMRLSISTFPECEIRVAELYAEVLKRKPSEGEVKSATGSLGNGLVTLSKLYRQMSTSPEAIQLAERSH